MRCSVRVACECFDTESGLGSPSFRITIMDNATSTGGLLLSVLSMAPQSTSEHHQQEVSRAYELQGDSEPERGIASIETENAVQARLGVSSADQPR